MLRALMIAALALMLTACAGLTASPHDAVKPIEELKTQASKPPMALTKKCKLPVNLPTRALSAGEVERFWGGDRVSLAVCGKRLTALRNFYKTRDDGLAGVTEQPAPEPVQGEWP